MSGWFPTMGGWFATTVGSPSSMAGSFPTAVGLFPPLAGLSPTIVGFIPPQRRLVPTAETNAATGGPVLPIAGLNPAWKPDPNRRSSDNGDRVVKSQVLSKPSVHRNTLPSPAFT
jgi:hypothetical protein